MSDDGKRRLPQAEIPVRWKGGGTTIHDKATVDTGIAAPTEDEMKLYGEAGRTTCATCKKFDHAAGQAQIQREKFAQKLIAEYEWKIHHLGASIEAYGLCGEGEGRATSVFSAACEHYRPRNGRVRGLFSGM